jgi:hypothetical protein
LDEVSDPRLESLVELIIEYVETRHAVMFQDCEKPGLLRLIEQALAE